MTITIRFPPETEKKLQERAAQAGQSVEGFLQKLVEREVLGTNGGPGATPARPSRDRSSDEMLAPVREAFARSGMTDEELAALVEDVREEIWQEHQVRRT
jgi:hypothetical protein